MSFSLAKISDTKPTTVWENLLFIFADNTCGFGMISIFSLTKMPQIHNTLKKTAPHLMKPKNSCFAQRNKLTPRLQAPARSLAIKTNSPPQNDTPKKRRCWGRLQAVVSLGLQGKTTTLDDCILAHKPPSGNEPAPSQNIPPTP